MIFNVHSYGFSPAINAYRAFGFTCNGNENSLSNCQQTGAVCRTDDVDHALAVECGGSGPRKLMPTRADWVMGSLVVSHSLFLILCVASECQGMMRPWSAIACQSSIVYHFTIF